MMAKKITETIGFARILLDTYETIGVGGFTRYLRDTASMIVEESGEEETEINARFLTILSSLLQVLYGSQAEQITRQQIRLSENFINERDMKEKITLFVKDLSIFIERFDQVHKQSSLSEKALLYLATCPLEKLRNVTCESLADQFQYTRSHFSSKFKAEQNMSIHDAILSERLNRSRALLQDTRTVYSVAKVAEMLGFSDHKYFSRLFKKKFGCLPSSVR